MKTELDRIEEQVEYFVMKGYSVSQSVTLAAGAILAYHLGRLECLEGAISEVGDSIFNGLYELDPNK